jgi:hypothetical protein
LPEVHAGGGSLQAHADINGDAKVDHILATGRGLTAAADADADADAADAAYARRVDAGCLGFASTGLPVRDALWNASICTSERNGNAAFMNGGSTARSRAGSGPGGRALAAAAPLLLPAHDCRHGDCGGRMDAVFLVSSGRMTSVGADGALRWACAACTLCSCADCTLCSLHTVQTAYAVQPKPTPAALGICI